MKCQKCDQDKLSNEFPSFTLSKECDHSPWHCLRCTTKHWESHQQCSQCLKPVHDSKEVRRCFSILETLFPEITPYDTEDGESGQNITVLKMDGESFECQFQDQMTISALKEKIEEFLEVPVDKQSLLYNQQTLEEFGDDFSRLCTMGEYGIKAGSTLHLMVLLYAIPVNLNNVVFDLSWGYPSTGRDYLDAMAFSFNGQEWRRVVHYNSKTIHNGAIVHSGDVMDDRYKIGHHKIEVFLDKLPSDITHVYFTLSAYRAGNISAYRDPSLRFYDKSRPGTTLCKDETYKTGRREAIVMCSLSRPQQKWLVHSSGAMTDGKITKLEPLLSTIQNLIAETGKYKYVPFKVFYKRSARTK